VNAMRTWTQFGPKASFPKKSCGEVRDRARKLFVRLLRAFPLRIVAQQGGRIFTDPLRHGVHRNAGIEEGGGVDAPEIVESGGSEADHAGPARKLL
jgi:hypothetical protein